MTPEQFCKKHGVKVVGKFVDTARDESGWEHTAYAVKVKYKGGRLSDRRIKFPYRMGVAHTQFDPMGALYAVASDANVGETLFDEFCSDFGVDPDSRSARRSWLQCRKLRRKVEAFCWSEDMLTDFLALEY